MGLFKDVNNALKKLEEAKKDKASKTTKPKVASKTAEEDPKIEKDVEDLYAAGLGPEDEEPKKDDDKKKKKDKDEDLDEQSATGGVTGYQTPGAFTGGKSANEKKRKKTAVDSTGYELVETTYKRMMREMYNINEVSYREYKKDPNSTPSQKVNRGIAEVNKMLAEIEKIVHNNLRLKTETGVSSSNFWKPTGRRFGKIGERLVRIANKLKELSQ
jgi:hypothetical protein